VKPGRARRKPRPEALGSLVSRVLDDLGLDETALVSRVVGCWENAVGSEIASHCQPTALRGKVLEATVDSSVWCQQLQLRSPEILSALRRELGDEAPTGLWLKVG
jgi:predicted nucleic acid-binding Zn ribbon protein